MEFELLFFQAQNLEHSAKLEGMESIDLDDEEVESISIPKSPRSYAELKAEINEGRSLELTREESKVFWQGKRADVEAEKEREAAAMEQFWAVVDTVTQNVVSKFLFFLIYGLWTLTPAVGIIIGIIYASNEHCPGQPSIAPLLIILGLMSTLVGFSLISQRNSQLKIPLAVPGQGVDMNNLESPPEALESLESEVDDDEPSTLAQTIGVCAGGCFVCVIVIFKLVHLILFIATSVIVFRFAERVEFSKVDLTEEEIESRYCNEILFRFAFCSITLSLGILGLLLICCCCGCWCFVAWTAYASREPQESSSNC